MTKQLLRLEYIDADQLAENPANWRTHNDGQLTALKDVIADVGWAGALLYNERTKRLIDGHARKKIVEGKVPVLIGDWSEDDERKILATLDPLAAMAEASKESLGKLLATIETESDAVQAMLDGLGDPEQRVGELKQLAIKKPPSRTWCLIGIPTAKYQTIVELIERIANTEDTIVETTVNNG